MIENARRTAVRTIWAPLILHDLLMSRRRVPSCSDVWDALAESRERRATSICSQLCYFPAASCNLIHICEGGCFFSLGVVVSLSLIRPYSHSFFFFFFPLPKTTENNQGWTPDIHLYLHALCCISLLQCSLCRGRIKEILSVHQYLHIQCVLLFCASADVWFVTECTGFGVYLSSKVFTVYLISNTKE